MVMGPDSVKSRLPHPYSIPSLKQEKYMCNECEMSQG